MTEVSFLYVKSVLRFRHLLCSLEYEMSAKDDDIYLQNFGFFQIDDYRHFFEKKFFDACEKIERDKAYRPSLVVHLIAYSKL